MKIYVGNLSYSVTEDEIAVEFGAYGKVESVVIPLDKLSEQSKGFAFVEMESETEAKAAISVLNGKTLKERPIMVNVAPPRMGTDGGGSSVNRWSGSYGRNNSGSRKSSRPGGRKKQSGGKKKI